MARDIEHAAIAVFGEVPYSWVNHEIRTQIESTLDQHLPAVYAGYPMPTSTYIIYCIAGKGVTYRILNVNAFLNATFIQSFVNMYPVMRQEADMQAELDVRNFHDEAIAKQELESVIVSPQFDISNLYRYTVAVNQSLVALITPEMTKRALYELRKNPYLFFAYGAPQSRFMPLLWGEI